MNKNELIRSIRKKSGLTNQEAKKALQCLTNTIAYHLSKGEDIQLPGFGTFRVRETKEKAGRNPQTGEALTIPAKTIPAFKPGKALKEAVQNLADIEDPAD